MRIRYAKSADQTAWLRMRSELWPDSVAEHPGDIRSFFEGTPVFIDQVIVCEGDAAELIGFAELRIRNYAEGSYKTAVPYLEGWFVDGAYRGQGVGALLIAGAERWARSLGYSELASDAAINNQASIAAHLALGFQEIERTVCFLKKLSRSDSIERDGPGYGVSADAPSGVAGNLGVGVE